MSHTNNKKVICNIPDVSTKKVVKNKENPDSYLSKSPSWRFSRCDNEKWSILVGESFKDIFKMLQNFETRTWSDIWKSNGSKRSGTENHFISINSLINEAQKRAADLLIYDDVFSLKLSSVERLFGIVDDGVFYILWYDSKHEICPSFKSHT